MLANIVLAVFVGIPVLVIAGVGYKLGRYVERRALRRAHYKKLYEQGN